MPLQTTTGHPCSLGNNHQLCLANGWDILNATLLMLKQMGTVMMEVIFAGFTAFTTAILTCLPICTLLWLRVSYKNTKLLDAYPMQMHWFLSIKIPTPQIPMDMHICSSPLLNWLGRRVCEKASYKCLSPYLSLRTKILLLVPANIMQSAWISEVSFPLDRKLILWHHCGSRCATHCTNNILYTGLQQFAA